MRFYQMAVQPHRAAGAGPITKEPNGNVREVSTLDGFKMLKLINVDRVDVRRSVSDKDDCYALLSCQKDLAEMNGTKCIEKYLKGGYIQMLRLHVNGNRIDQIIYCFYGKYSVGYRFKGVVNFDACEAATQTLGDHSFFGVMTWGRVKALELAVDVVGHSASDYLYLMRGTKSSFVCRNEAMDGYSFYVGNRLSAVQFVAYDKSQERRDKKLSCQFNRRLRLEMRIQNRSESLDYIIAEMACDDPFERLCVVELATALSFGASLVDWPLFISACQMYGVAAALKQFPSHRKTFRKYLESLAIQQLQPAAKLFCKPLRLILPYSPVWDVLASKTNFLH